MWQQAQRKERETDITGAKFLYTNEIKLMLNKITLLENKILIAIFRTATEKITEKIYYKRKHRAWSTRKVMWHVRKYLVNTKEGGNREI